MPWVKGAAGARGSHRGQVQKPTGLPDGRAPGPRTCHDGAMSQPDDIEKLLREIDAMNAGSSQGAALPAPAQNKAIEPAREVRTGGSGRVAWTGASAVGGLLAGGVAGTILTFLPSVSTVSTAVGCRARASAAGRLRQRAAGAGSDRG